MTLTAMTPLYRIEISVPPHALDAFEDALAPHVIAVSADADATAAVWQLAGYCENLPDHDALKGALETTASAFEISVPEPRIEVIENTDWVTTNLLTFPPVTVGRFFVYGSHHTKSEPAGRIGIRIDAGQAFGTGAHGSTAGCLLAMDTIFQHTRPRRILDLGCGSAILGIAAAKLIRCPVLATDIDPVAVRVARENADLNGVGPWVKTMVASGVTAAMRQAGPFDMVIANILAGPLQSMAPQIAGCMAPGGTLILSGLLARESRRLENRYRAVGCRLINRSVRDGWATLILRRLSPGELL